MENGVDLSNDKYIEFVNNSISEYRKYSDRLTRSESSLEPYDVQYILAHYHTAKLGLLAELCRRKRIYKILDRDFNLWWNSCLLASKQKLTISGKKFPAVKDYTVQAEEDNKEEYTKRQLAVQDAEDEYEFLKALKADWDSFQFTLQTLNDNMKSELKSLTLDGNIYQGKPLKKVRLVDESK